MATRTWNLIGLTFLVGCAVSRATGSHYPDVTTFRVINLGSSTVTAATVYGWPIHESGIRVAPGSMVTGRGSFAATNGQSKYEFYWMLDDGSVHSSFVDLHDRVPRNFKGPVVFAIQDTSVSVNWASFSAAYREYIKSDFEGELPRPKYSACGGSLIEQGSSKTSKSSAGTLATSTANVERCYLDQYLPKDDLSQPTHLTSEEERQQAAAFWTKTVKELRQKGK